MVVHGRVSMVSVGGTRVEWNWRVGLVLVREWVVVVSGGRGDLYDFAVTVKVSYVVIYLLMHLYFTALWLSG